jgi:hypothetical protein
MALTPGERDLIERLALGRGLTMSDAVRQAVRAAARAEGIVHSEVTV